MTANQKLTGSLLLSLCFILGWSVAFYAVLSSWWNSTPMQFWAASSLALLALGRICRLLDAAIRMWERTR